MDRGVGESPSLELHKMQFRNLEVQIPVSNVIAEEENEEETMTVLPYSYGRTVCANEKRPPRQTGY